MTQQTKTTLAISATYCVLFITALASMVFVVHEQGAKLEAAKIAIAEHAAKEASYNNVMRLLETSASNRAELKSYFITEKDTISFISELESAAAGVGVSLETTELSVTPASVKDGMTTPAVLGVGVSFKGSEAAVKQFITLLENVPYRKDLPSFNISSEGAAGWSGHTTLRITMTS